VYKAHLVKMNSNTLLHAAVTTQTVAVKTLKGKCAHDHVAKLTSFSTCVVGMRICVTLTPYIKGPPGT